MHEARRCKSCQSSSNHTTCSPCQTNGAKIVLHYHRHHEDNKKCCPQLLPAVSQLQALNLGELAHARQVHITNGHHQRHGAQPLQALQAGLCDAKLTVDAELLQRREGRGQARQIVCVAGRDLRGNRGKLSALWAGWMGRNKG